MRLNVIYQAKLNERQYCWPAVSQRVGVWGGQGFSAGAPCSLQLSVGCQVIPHVFRCWTVILELFSRPTPPSSHGRYLVSIFVSTVCSV